MRILGTIDGKSNAETVVAHLLTLGIATHVEQVEGGQHWEIWVRDEDRLAEARRELEKYQGNPNDPLYSAAIRQAQSIVRTHRDKKIAAQKNLRTIRRTTGMSQRLPPLTLALLILCSALSLLTDFSKPAEKSLGSAVLRQLMFVDPIPFREHQDPSDNLRQGQIWRIVTPMFLHGSPIHLIFNMIWLIQLGRLIEWREGTVKFGLFVLAIQAVSALLQGLMPESLFGYPIFVGFSGVVYGLFGFVWVKSSYRPDLYRPLDQTTVIILMLWLAAGFINLLGPIANLGHLGGLIAGAALGWVARDWIRTKHMKA